MTNLKFLVVIVAAILLSSCQSLQQQVEKQIARPDIGYKSFSVGKVSSTSIQLLPVFTITNHNMFSIPVNNISYQLSLNSKQLVAGNSKSIGTLPANQSKDVTLAMDISNQSLMALQQLLFKNGQIDYLINGSVNVIGLDIPFEKRSTIFMPKVTLNRIEVAKASFNEMELVIDVDINNRNDFQLPLDNLSYSVASGTTALFNGTLSQQLIKSGNQTLKLPLTFKPRLLFSNIFSMLRQPNLPLTIDIKSPLFSATHSKTLNLSNLF